VNAGANTKNEKARRRRACNPTTEMPFICFSLSGCLAGDMSKPYHSLTASSLTTITYSLDACQRVETRFLSSRYARSRLPRYCGSAAGTELSLEGCVCPWKQTLHGTAPCSQSVASQASRPSFLSSPLSCAFAHALSNKHMPHRSPADVP
jgi:hypothetical protein